MKKFIVTTTINPPTIATKKYASFKDWTLIVVGDKKTPHETYNDLDCIYLTPDYMQMHYPDLCRLTGWNTFDIRNIGYIEAHMRGADVIATVDDDNIPYENWGDNILVDKEVEVDIYTNLYSNYFDPISVTNCNDLWHRGYPIECLNVKNNNEYKGKFKRNVLIQADFWDGDPDIDAICRLSKKPIEGFQLKYIYFIDKSKIIDLTVPILPFSKIDELGAGMYKGNKVTLASRQAREA